MNRTTIKLPAEVGAGPLYAYVDLEESTIATLDRRGVAKATQSAH